MDPQFRHAFADRFDIAKVAKLKPRKTSRDFGRCPAIPQPFKPNPKRLGLTHLNHATTIGDIKSSLSSECRL